MPISLILTILAWVGMSYWMHWTYHKSYKAGVSAGYLIGCYKNDLEADKHMRSKAYLQQAYKIVDKLEVDLAWQLALLAEDELV